MEISVSNRFLRFQSAFLRLISAKITSFIATRIVMINAAYIVNGVGGISVFLLAAIIGGENIYRDVRPEPERIHEN